MGGDAFSYTGHNESWVSCYHEYSWVMKHERCDSSKWETEMLSTEDTVSECNTIDLWFYSHS